MAGCGPTARTIPIRPYLDLSRWRFQRVIKEQPTTGTPGGYPLYLGWTNQPGNAPESWPTHQRSQSTARKKEGRSAVRRTQESDRTTSSAAAGIKVCSRAILHGGGCAKYQTASPLPQPSAEATGVRNDVGTSPENILEGKTHPTNTASEEHFFNTHAC